MAKKAKAGAYVLSHEAGRDLEEIEEYTARRWGDSQAEKYLWAIFDAFGHLAERPALGRQHADVLLPYLVYGVGNHLIVYRHNPLKNRVEVLNVLHPAMNVEQRMEEALLRMAKHRKK